MFTTVAYSESQDPGAVFVAQAAVADQHVKTYGDAIYIGEFNRLMGALCCIGTLGTEARLVAPSLYRVNPYYICPLELALYPDGEVHHSVNPRVSIPLDINEALECWINSDPAAAEQASTMVWLASGGITPVEGSIITVNAEITLALLAGQWAFSEINFVDEMPVGNYDVVGARLVCSTSVGFRFVPVGASHRPGAPNSADVELGRNSIFRFGQLGVWFNFSTIQPPGVEVLGSAAVGSATYQLYIDVMKK